MVNSEFSIRLSRRSDHASIVTLFENGNAAFRDIASTSIFSAYIREARKQEIDRIDAYYSERGGRFWVVDSGGSLVAMVGLEPKCPNAMELRRLYVDPSFRTAGLGQQLLSFAEHETRSAGKSQLHLATSSYQSRAVRLYQRQGYVLCNSQAKHNPARGLDLGEARLEATKILMPR